MVDWAPRKFLPSNLIQTRCKIERTDHLVDITGQRRDYTCEHHHGIAPIAVDAAIRLNETAQTMNFVLIAAFDPTWDRGVLDDF